MATNENALVFSDFDIENLDLNIDDQGNLVEPKEEPGIIEEPEVIEEDGKGDEGKEDERKGGEDKPLSLSEYEGKELSEEEVSEEDSKLRQQYVDNHFKYLKEQNLLLVDDDYEFDGNIEQVYLEDAHKRQLLAADNIIKGVPEEYKNIVDYLLLSSQQGISVDVDKLTSEKASVTKLKTLDFNENTEAAEDFLADYYEENSKIPKSAIRAAIEVHKDDNTLIETANKFKDEIINGYEASLLESVEKSRESLIEQQNAQRQYYLQVNNIIQDKEWDTSTKRMIQTELYNGDVIKKLNTLLAEDAQGLVDLLQFISGYEIGKGFRENVIDKKTKAKAANKVKQDFFQAIATPKKQSNGQKTRKQNEFDSADIAYFKF